MKTIIAGSRTLTDATLLETVISKIPFEISEVVCGCASGIDKLGEQWANKNIIPVKYFPANWSLGKQAGYLRNKQMAEYADALFVIWDGFSKGTKMMVDLAKGNGLKVFGYNKATEQYFSYNIDYGLDCKRNGGI